MMSPTITDIDNDFDVDIVYCGWDKLVHVWDMPFEYNPFHVPWPTFGGNAKRDGVVFSLAASPVETQDDIPAAGFTVGAAFPNPFNPSISARLYIPQSSDLELTVFDVQGRKIKSLHAGAISSGWHTVVWDGRDDSGRGQASGMYFLRALNLGEVIVQKMTLVK
jgi:hypothetical protein